MMENADDVGVVIGLEMQQINDLVAYQQLDSNHRLQTYSQTNSKDDDSTYQHKTIKM